MAKNSMTIERITARVQVTVEIDICLENWDESNSVEQVHREGSEAGLARIYELCQRDVRIIGKPKVEAIITSKD